MIQDSFAEHLVVCSCLFPTARMPLKTRMTCTLRCMDWKTTTRVERYMKTWWGLSNHLRWCWYESHTGTHTLWDILGDEGEGKLEPFLLKLISEIFILLKTWTQRRLCFQTQAEADVRSCCLSEIKQTEEKYTETLESIEKVLKCMFFNMDHRLSISDMFLRINKAVWCLKGWKRAHAGFFFLKRWPSHYVLISSGSNGCRFQSECKIPFCPWRFSLLFSISWILWRNSSLLLKSIGSSSTFR